MEFGLIKIAVGVIAFALGSYFDLFNKRNVPDVLSYAFLAISALLALLSPPNISILGIAVPSMWFFAIACALSIIGFAVYKMGYVGGADVIFLVALFLILPVHPFREQTFFFLYILIFAGVLFTLYFLAYYGGRIIEKRIMPDRFRAIVSLLLFVGYVVIIYMVNSLISISFEGMFFLLLLIFSSSFFYAYRDSINDWMIENVEVGKIEEEDVIAIEKMDQALVKKYNIGKLVDSGMLEKLKTIGEKEKIEKFPIYKNMPFFLPFLFLSLLINLVFEIAVVNSFI